MNHHKWLYRTRLIMTEVQSAMQNLADFIEKDGARPTLFYDGIKDAMTISLRKEEFQSKLRDCFYSIIDLWPEILINDARRYEISVFISRYRTIRHTIEDLTAIVKANPVPSERLYGGTQIILSYHEYIQELDSDMALILKEFADTSSVLATDLPRLSGIARRLNYYVHDTDDEFFERLILDHRTPSLPLKWHGSKVAAGLFARHFSLTDSEMNRAFIFNSHGKSYRGLKISSDIATKGDDRHSILSILKDYPNPR